MDDIWLTQANTAVSCSSLLLLKYIKTNLCSVHEGTSQLDKHCINRGQYIACLTLVRNLRKYLQMLTSNPSECHPKSHFQKYTCKPLVKFCPPPITPCQLTGTYQGKYPAVMIFPAEKQPTIFEKLLLQPKVPTCYFHISICDKH